MLWGSGGARTFLSVCVGGGGSTINWLLLNLHLDVLVISISDMRLVTDRSVNSTLYD